MSGTSPTVQSLTRNECWYADWHFWFAMGIGPCVWLLLRWQMPGAGDGVINAELLLYTCLIYPVLEEMAFRGFVQTSLLERLAVARRAWLGLSVANVLTSAMFAVAHMFNQPLLWALVVFFPSLVFGYFRDRSDSVWPAILLHCWYNAGFFLWVR